MNFWSDYGLFLLKALTVIFTVLIILAIANYFRRARAPQLKKLVLHDLNKHLDYMKNIIFAESKNKKELKQIQKELKLKQKQEHKSQASKPCLFIIKFDGDVKASANTKLREAVTAVLAAADKTKDEVLVKIDSAGGYMHTYGLAASQLARIRQAGLKLTTSVDKVAASGGYMMACVADRIIAAPFAVVGSIGVVAGVPNFNRWLEDKNIDFEQYTAGEYKRTVTMFGKNTEKGKKKFQDDLEQAHTMFKNFITQHRQVDIDKVATGEHWHASDAIKLNLIDEILTSDDYISARQESHRLLALDFMQEKGMQRFARQAAMAVGYLFKQTKREIQDDIHW